MSPWIAKGLAVVVAASVGVGVGFIWPTNAASSPADGPARAWIDDPLDGAMVALGPVEVVAHAYDPARLAKVTLMVDGTVVVENPLDDTGVLAYATWTWTPEAEGVYVLEAFGTGRNGTIGLAGRAVVTVGQRSLATSTTTTVPDSTTTTLPESTTTTILAGTTTTTVTVTTRPTPTTTPPSTTTPTSPPTTTPPTTAPTTTVPGPCTPPPPILLSPTDGASFIGPDQLIALDWSAWRGPTPSCQPSGFYVELAARSEGSSTGEWS